MADRTIVNGVYKPTYNWGAPSCIHFYWWNPFCLLSGFDIFDTGKGEKPPVGWIWVFVGAKLPIINICWLVCLSLLHPPFSTDILGFVENSILLGEFQLFLFFPMFLLVVNFFGPHCSFPPLGFRVASPTAPWPRSAPRRSSVAHVPWPTRPTRPRRRCSMRPRQWRKPAAVSDVLSYG